MSKIPDLIGFGFIGGTIYSYIGMIDHELRWPVFWGCAAGALCIILLRRWQKKKKNQMS